MYVYLDVQNTTTFKIDLRTQVVVYNSGKSSSESLEADGLLPEFTFDFLSFFFFFVGGGGGGRSSSSSSDSLAGCTGCGPGEGAVTSEWRGSSGSGCNEPISEIIWFARIIL